MKQLLLIQILLVISICEAMSCPFCGCGNSNFQIGILPTYNHAFVGIRYTYSHFSTRSYDKTQFSDDHFNSTELWGGYQFGKLQVMAFIPYLSSRKSGDDGVISSKGLGDIMILGNYRIFSSSRTNSTNHQISRQNLMMGGGIKLKTGKSRIDIGDPDFTVGDFSATPGTGSTDYLINLTHSLLKGNSGIVTNVTYRINTNSAQQFQYGNRTYVNIACFHSWTTGTWIVRPSMGLNLIVNAVNRYQGTVIAGSNGHVASALAGINVQRSKIGLLINGFLPIQQNLFDGQTHFLFRGSMAVTYSF